MNVKNSIARIRDTIRSYRTPLLTPEEKEIQSLLLSLPKSVAPFPLLSRKYLRHSFTPKSLLFPRLTTALSVVTGIVLVFFSASAKWALPGEPLYNVKKAEEQVSAIIKRPITPEPELQVALTVQRIEDAKAVLSKQDATQESKQAAMQELFTQTQNAVTSLSAKDVTTESKKKISESLAGIKSKQDEIVTIALADKSTKQVAEKTSEVLNKLISAAASSEEPAALKEQTTMQGTVTEVQKEYFKVDQNLFKVTPQTKFLFGDKSVDFSDISANMKVLVEYQNGVDKQTALTVKLLDKELSKKPAPLVTSKPGSSTIKTIVPKEKPEVPEAPTNETRAGIIPEDPAPECTVNTPC